MKHYEQLSLFEEEEKNELTVNDLAYGMLDLISSFESEEEFKERVDGILENILALYIKYEPSVEVMEQLIDSGRMRLVGLKPTIEFLKAKVEPSNLKELNELISALCHIMNQCIENKQMPLFARQVFKNDTERDAFIVAELVRAYCSVLSTYKEHLGV